MTLRRNRLRLLGGSLAAALALTVLVGTPTGQSAAAQFLSQFRSQRFVAVTVDPSQGRGAFMQLERLGTVRYDRTLRPDVVASIPAAEARVGFRLRLPDPATLPAGMPAAPAISVVPAAQHRFTFDRARATAYFASIGRSDIVISDRFDGATLVVQSPAAVLLTYQPPSDPSHMLMIGQAGELVVETQGGVTLEELRDFLLGLPGLPPETARQLRAIQDWRSTLPIPIPADRATWQQTTVGGGPALLLAETGGLGTGVIWQRDGQVGGVAGTITSAEALRIAEGLR